MRWRKRNRREEEEEEKEEKEQQWSVGRRRAENSLPWDPIIGVIELHFIIIIITTTTTTTTTYYYFGFYHSSSHIVSWIIPRSLLMFEEDTVMAWTTIVRCPAPFTIIL